MIINSELVYEDQMSVSFTLSTSPLDLSRAAQYFEKGINLFFLSACSATHGGSIVYVMPMRLARNR